MIKEEIGREKMGKFPKSENFRLARDFNYHVFPVNF